MVDAHLAEIARAAQGFLDDAARAETKEQLVHALVRYTRVTKRVPPPNVAKSLDDKLGIPAVIGLELLASR